MFLLKGHQPSHLPDCPLRTINQVENPLTNDPAILPSHMHTHYAPCEHVNPELSNPISYIKLKKYIHKSKTKRVRHSEQVQVVSKQKLLKPTIQLVTVWSQHHRHFSPSFPIERQLYNNLPSFAPKGQRALSRHQQHEPSSRKNRHLETKIRLPQKRRRERLGTSWKIDHPKDKGK